VSTNSSQTTAVFRINQVIHRSETHHIYTFGFYIFTESLRGIGGKATAATLSRHGKLAGGFGKTIQALYGEMSGDYKEKLGKKKNPQKKEDIKFTVQLIQSNKLVTRQGGGRNHKAYKSLHNNSVSKKILTKE